MSYPHEMLLQDVIDQFALSEGLPAPFEPNTMSAITIDGLVPNRSYEARGVCFRGKFNGNLMNRVSFKTFSRFE